MANLSGKRIVPKQRGVTMRTSFVVGRDRGAGGGALAMLGLIARLGLGGKVGKGTQGMSWIHENDLNNLFAKAIEEIGRGRVRISVPSTRVRIEGSV